MTPGSACDEIHELLTSRLKPDPTSKPARTLEVIRSRTATSASGMRAVMALPVRTGRASGDARWIRSSAYHAGAGDGGIRGACRRSRRARARPRERCVDYLVAAPRAGAGRLHGNRREVSAYWKRRARRRWRTASTCACFQDERRGHGCRSPPLVPGRARRVTARGFAISGCLSNSIKTPRRTAELDACLRAQPTCV